MNAYSVSAVNQLPAQEKRSIYARLIAPELLAHLHLSPELRDETGRDLLQLNCPEGSPFAEMGLFHQIGFNDPVLYGQITDTLNRQIHVLLYILNDPESERFNVDRMPDGRPTRFGTQLRNLEAELAAMQYGLAPGQIRRGLRLLGPAIVAFEHFVASLGHEMYFIEPLYYHNAVIFERYGFAYVKGRKLMERIQEGFAENGDLTRLLDGSTPFRMPEAARSVRLRSWALHDGILEEPFNNTTMYKWVNKSAGIVTCQDCSW